MTAQHNQNTSDKDSHRAVCDDGHNHYYDVIVVGGGLAALTVLLSLPSTYRILWLYKQDDDSASALAQGGIAGVLSPSDSVDRHVCDTLVAGASVAGEYLCDESVVRQMIAQSKQVIDWLVQLSVPFDRQDDGALHLTCEGGHGMRRICHVADHTGLSVMQVLFERVKHCTHIHVLKGCVAYDVLTAKKAGQIFCHGVACVHLGKAVQFFADDVVLATGGLGQIYKHTTTPTACTGDGIAMAYRAGCRIANAEFVQFHPTGLVCEHLAGRTPLISEAVRGEGGVLINHHGKRFMAEYDKRQELAPRDIVARSIAFEMAKTGKAVYLDISHHDGDKIRSHFVQIYQTCLSHGIDMTCEPIPVAPVQHYFCGGVLTDAAGRSDVVGLYCLGEMACTGLHGGNRLASNSLLECLVVGKNAVQALCQNAKQTWQKPTPKHNWSCQHIDDVGRNGTGSPKQLISTKHELKQQVQRALGVLRHRDDVAKMVQMLYNTQKTLTQNAYPLDKTHIDIAQMELLNLSQCAYLVAKASLGRQDGVGCHYWAEH